MFRPDGCQVRVSAPKVFSLNDLLTPFARGPWRHIRNLVTDRHYRTLATLLTRYRSVPPRQPRVIRFDGWTIEAPDVPSFLSAFYYVFVRRTYAFRPSCPRGVVVDCGANIGLSVLYFKTLYPDLRVVAYEADPAICRTLERNVTANRLEGVEVINAAVGSAAGVVNFLQDGTDSGRVTDDLQPGMHVAQVDAVCLGDELEGHDVQFLKVDIEGAETDALIGCVGRLSQVRSMCVELHTFPEKPQRLGQLLSVLEEAGFRVAIESIHNVTAPLSRVDQTLSNGMDLQLHLFAYRD